MRRIWIVLLTISLPVFIIISLLYYRVSINRQNTSTFKDNGREVEFVVKPGEKVYEIAQHLKDQGLINSATLFKIYVRFNSLSGNLQAGSYKIKKTLSLVELAELLKHGTFDLRLTFPEGWRREEMSEYLFESFPKDVAEKIKMDFLAKTGNLEGYLFPDTYVIPVDTESEELVRIMRENFDKRVDAKMRSDLNNQGLTLEQAIVLASIIEREAGNDKDRPVIAGILIKRLKSGWALEADATVQYAVANKFGGKGGWWPKMLSDEDLLIDSPYNTRKNRDLPPTPISNPGLSSILAVIYPLETPYWFYLTDKKGTAYFAKTLEEHEENVIKYLAK